MDCRKQQSPDGSRQVWTDTAIPGDARCINVRVSYWECVVVCWYAWRCHRGIAHTGYARMKTWKHGFVTCIYARKSKCMRMYAFIYKHENRVHICMHVCMHAWTTAICMYERMHIEHFLGFQLLITAYNLGVLAIMFTHICTHLTCTWCIHTYMEALQKKVLNGSVQC